MTRIFKVYDKIWDAGPMEGDPKEVLWLNLYTCTEFAKRLQFFVTMETKDYNSVEGKYIKGFIYVKERMETIITTKEKEGFYEDKTVGIICEGPEYEITFRMEGKVKGNLYIKVEDISIRFIPEENSKLTIGTKVFISTDNIFANSDSQVVDVDLNFGELWREAISDNVEDLVEQILKEEGKNPTKEEISQHPTVKKFKKLEQEIDFENLKAVPEHLKGILSRNLERR